METDCVNGYEATLQLIRERIEPKTTNGYLGRVRTMSAVFTLWDADLVDADGLIKCPVPDEEKLSFFGLLLRNKLGEVLEAIQKEADENECSESESDVEEELDEDFEDAEISTGQKRSKQQKKPKQSKPKKKKSKKTARKEEDWKSVSDVQSYKSALKWWYVEKKVEFSPALDKQLDRFMQGYRKKVSDLKQKGIMEIYEGKQFLAFEGYKMLAEEAIAMAPTPQSGKGNHKQGWTWGQSIFSWVYMILSWNLIARSVETGRIMLAHISWQNDALTIATPKHKSMLRMADFCGEMALAHLYANPNFPAICPVLAIAVLIFNYFCQRSYKFEKPETLRGK